MKTRKFLVLFSAMLTMIAMLIFCNGVVLAEELQVSRKTITKPQVSQNTYIDSQIIKSRDGGQICVKHDRETKCFVKIDCKTGEPIVEGSKTVEELFKRIGVRYIEAFESTCNSFTIDVPGNTRYYCSGGRCYPY